MRAIFSFDDGTIDDMRVAELLDKYDQDGIFYFIVYPESNNELKGRESLTAEQRKDIAEKFEVGSHTLTHRLLTRIPLEEAEAEIKLSKTMLEDELDVAITSFCYPRGYSNPAIQNLVIEAGYNNARSTLVGFVHQSENPFMVQTTVHMADRKEYAGQKWLDYALKMLDTAIRTPDSVFHAWSHSWELTENDGWHDFEELLKRVHENSHS